MSANIDITSRIVPIIVVGRTCWRFDFTHLLFSHKDSIILWGIEINVIMNQPHIPCLSEMWRILFDNLLGTVADAVRPTVGKFDLNRTVGDVQNRYDQRPDKFARTIKADKIIPCGFVDCD
jgi:hypothetical protein